MQLSSRLTSLRAITMKMKLIFKLRLESDRSAAGATAEWRAGREKCVYICNNFIEANGSLIIKQYCTSPFSPECWRRKAENVLWHNRRC